jgi:hypothetical protein
VLIRKAPAIGSAEITDGQLSLNQRGVHEDASDAALGAVID